MIVNEDKIMDKINRNLKIIDNLLMENGFYKYISKVVNIEDGTSQLYDNLKQTQQENARLKDKIEKLNEYVEDRISALTVSVDTKAKDEYFNNKCIGGVQELKNVKVILKEN